ncbi:hypothetical protein EXIGLDRAFT_773804 [Exidia glandulosa HHB12029]|uniref:Uncharacterized protein n=1 Tax=Exidia glandulosa HHB12029 TaxID=1314781 RepID=A0A165EML8_EXIGL|nr:hypothetical protein EXIGLDRAFT_773804 [Exidia glandulosa HHB12029]
MAANSDQNTSAFTRALAEAETRQHQQLRADIPFAGAGKRNISFLEDDDDIFPSTINLTSTGVSQLRPIAPYPSRDPYGSSSAVFRHAPLTGNDTFALQLPTADLTQYPFTWTIPGAPTMPMPPRQSTTDVRSRSPPITPYVKRQRFHTQPPLDGLCSLSPYPSPLSTPHPGSISPQAGSADYTPTSSRRVTRSGRAFAQLWRGATTRSSPSAAVPLGSSVQNHSLSYSTSPLPIALPALPAGLPTPTPGLPNVHQDPHACVLQCSTSFNGVFKPGARPRGDRYKTHMFGSGSGKKNPPCSVAVQMGCTKDKISENVEVVGTFLLRKEPGLAPTFEYAQICGDLREALVAWYAKLVAQASEYGSVEQDGEADDGLTDRDAEYDEEFDEEDFMYE